MSSYSGLVTTAALDTKATEFENKMRSINGLSTTDALNTRATEIESDS